MMKPSDILCRIKQTVREIEPDSDVILYGSRARGDFTNNSDWDILILVNGPVDDRRTDAIRHSLYEIEWETGQIISTIVRSRDIWSSDRNKAMPFVKAVQQYGKRV
ncbi:MAG: nucleotidyltransferase domain-containing protein [Desulfatirhabdiaceae bacterium]